MSKIVSFVSYKGGSGRTSIVFNLLPYFDSASEEHPIIMLDFDVDSKGLTYLIDDKKDLVENYSEDCINVFNILDSEVSYGFNKQYSSIKEHPFYKRTLHVGKIFGLDPGSVLFIPVPIIEKSKISQYDSSHNADTPIRDLNEFASLFDCPAIILDLPTGTQLTSTIGFDRTDVMVIALKITKQFRDGTYELLKFYLSKDKENIKYIIVPNVVPDFSHFDYNKEKFRKRILDFVEKAYTETGTNNISSVVVCKKFIEEVFGINEISRFKYEESVLWEIMQKSDPSPDEIEASKVYKMLAEEIFN